MTRRRTTNTAFAKRVGCDPSFASLLRRGLRLPGTDLYVTIIEEYELDADETNAAYLEGVEAYARYLRLHIFGPDESLGDVVPDEGTDTDPKAEQDDVPLRQVS